MIERKFWPELIGMKLYQTSSEECFYAWNHKHALKKRPADIIYFITNMGKRIIVVNKTIPN